MAGTVTYSAINYTDILFKNDYNLPSIQPNYLISVISMTLRNPNDPEVKKIIQKDPLLREVLFTDADTLDTYDKKLILILVRILQQAYGIDFLGLGHFSKDIYITEGEYKESLFYKSISLIWNYSPFVSEDGTLNIKNELLSDNIDE